MNNVKVRTAKKIWVQRQTKHDEDNAKSRCRRKREIVRDPKREQKKDVVRNPKEEAEKNVVQSPGEEAEERNSPTSEKERSLQVPK